LQYWRHKRDAESSDVITPNTCMLLHDWTALAKKFLQRLSTAAYFCDSMSSEVHRLRMAQNAQKDAREDER